MTILNTRYNRILIAGIYSVVSACATASKAGLVSSFLLSQGVYENPPNTIVQTAATSVPFHQTISRDNTFGGVISTTYDAYDAGSTAGLTISTTASAAAGNFVFEQSIGLATGSTGFVFSQPVSYSITIFNNSSQVDGNFDFLNPGSSYLILESSLSAYTTFQFDGTLQAGRPYTIDEFWSLDNSHVSPTAPPITGSETITMRFTAIPEPTSFGAIALTATLALRCRRRLPLRTQHQPTL